MSCRLVIAEDYKMVREVFEDIAAQSGRYEVAASFSSAAQLLDWCRTSEADIALLDVLFPGSMSGLDAAGELKKLRPDMKIVIVTSMPEVSYMSRARAVGAPAARPRPRRQGLQGPPQEGALRGAQHTRCQGGGPGPPRDQAGLAWVSERR